MTETVAEVTASTTILQTAIDCYRPSHVFGLFSGGHDSLCATHLAAQHPRFTAAVHINTGIGVPETRQFVRDTCHRFGWSLLEYHPPVSYEAMVVEHGFPGPALHWKMYQRLKERCLRQLLRDHGTRRDRVVLVSGKRRQESARRMRSIPAANIQAGPHPSRRAVWTNVIADWIQQDKDAYMTTYQLPRNPVVARLCMSGECLCGCFAEPGELEMLRVFYPETAAAIDRLAEQVAAAGKHAVWGTRPPQRYEQVWQAQYDLPLCYSCEEKFHAASHDTR